MSLTLYACLMVVIFWNTLVECVSSADSNQYVYKGKIYKISDTETDFENGKAFCEQNGGMLAKITQQTVTDNFYAPLSQFLSPRVGENCAWIGASDLSANGRWKWTDGQPVRHVSWKIPPPEIYFYTQYYLTCGRLCQSDNTWIWEQVRCDTSLKLVCEYDACNTDEKACGTTPELPKSTWKAASSVDAKEIVHNGKIYKVPDEETDFANAVTSCEKDGGRLAKIIPEPGTSVLNAPMARFLSSRVGENCVWIGISDRKTEDIWVWVDGTLMYSVRWFINTHTHRFLKFIMDCGHLCPYTEEWAWTQGYCDKDLKFLCEYDAPVLKPVLGPTVKPDLESEQKPHKATRTVVIREPDANLIIGDPLFTLRIPQPTMCSRVCMKNEMCTVFNFNVDTFECKGYRRSSMITYKKNPKWTVWVLKRL